MNRLRWTVTTFVLSLLVPLADVAANPADSPPTKSFTYKKTKQADLEIVVHFPPGWKEADKRPAIVFFFGGGWENGTIKAFERQAAYLGFIQRKDAQFLGTGKRVGHFGGV